MSWTGTYSCDICGAIRGPSNHWWIALDDQGELTFAPFRETASDPQMRHLCSQTCCTTLLNRYLEAKP